MNKGNRNPCPCDDYILMERRAEEKKCMSQICSMLVDNKYYEVNKVGEGVLGRGQF